MNTPENRNDGGIHPGRSVRRSHGDRSDDGRTRRTAMSTRHGHDSGMRVLIVDDNVETAGLMKALLDRSGFDARTAYDGEEALKVADEFLPEVVFLDLALPGMGGREVAPELRRNPALAGAMIV